MDPVELNQRLVRIPGLSGEEGAVADAVEAAMGELGYRDVRRDALGSVIGLVGPEDAPVRLQFDGHMDVAKLQMAALSPAAQRSP